MIFSIFHIVPGDAHTLMCVDMPVGTPVPSVGHLIWLAEGESFEEWEVIDVSHNWRDLTKPKVMINVVPFQRKKKHVRSLLFSR